MIQDLIKLYDLIIEQTYFTHDDKIFRQTEGLAMGSPPSATLSEMYLQYLEYNNYNNIIQNNNIIGYFRYVDDIWIIFNHTRTDINHVLQEFNQVNNHIQFTLELETNRRLNFLDLTIHINNTNWNFSIFWKPTFTDKMISFFSCHPHKHKFAAVRYLINRLKTHHSSPELQRQKWPTFRTYYITMDSHYT
jgi:hypothetical protein